MITSREIRLKSRPVGMPTADNFELVTVSVPAPALGEVQVKNLWMWVDPYMRGCMVDRTSYDPHLPLGEATPARKIGEVAASNSIMYGWRPLFQLGEALQGGGPANHRQTICAPLNLAPLTTALRPRMYWRGAVIRLLVEKLARYAKRGTTAASTSMLRPGGKAKRS